MVSGAERTPPSSGQRTYLLLVDTTITLYESRDDWLELTLDIAWLAPPRLTVNAAVEVACWCPQDHNMHRVRTARWHSLNSHELAGAFAAGAAMLEDVLAMGPFDPRPWRVQAGSPRRPGNQPLTDRPLTSTRAPGVGLPDHGAPD